MLQNAYLLAKFGFDTAENEPAQNLQHFAKKIANEVTIQDAIEQCPRGDHGGAHIWLLPGQYDGPIVVDRPVLLFFLTSSLNVG